MSKRWIRALVATMIALMLLSPTWAMMEETEAQMGDIGVEAEEAPLPLAFEEGAALDGNVDPEVEPAWDAGDTGLTIEYEEADPSAQYDASQEEITPDGSAQYDALQGDITPEGTEQYEVLQGDVAPLEDAMENGLSLEGEESAVPEEEEALELMAVSQVNVGYAAIAPMAVVYADADLSLPVGAFEEGATVYVEAVERDGMLLRVRFDTQEARDWAQDIPMGYALASDALGFNDEETAALAQWLAGDPCTRWLDGVAIPCAVYQTGDYSVMADESAMGLGVTAHTQAEIQAFVNEHPAYRNQINIYSVAASDEPYAVGKLSAVNQQSALNMINQVRYIAGLDADVGLLPEQEDAMAAASLVLRLNSALSHYPARPAALADAAYDWLYQQGYVGAGHANIAMGYTATSSILAYMADADDRNIATVGHRRWIINPKLSRTVFGANGRFSAMYAHDLAGAGWQTRVAWPAQEMPRQYFSAGDPWSVSFGTVLDASQVVVDLVRVRDGMTWHFTQNQADGFFNVENSYYGQAGCVIFRPNSLDGIAEGDTFNVSIFDGANNALTRYTVHFFDLDLSAADPYDALNVTAVKTAGGNAISWNAQAGVTGYYVCRRTENSNYQIIADINDTGYLDVNVFDDLTYYYQVYAHNASITNRSAVSVKVRIPPDAVSLGDVKKYSVYKNAVLQLTASFTPANASAVLEWSSSKPGVATVDGNGLVTPVKKGTTIISVRTDNGKSATVKVKVVAPPKPKKVIMSASGTVVLNVGETLQLAATVQPAEANPAVKWSSSKKKAATVVDGLVTAVGEGTAKISAKAVNGKKATLKVKVVDPYKPTSVALNASGTVKLKVGETLQLSAALKPDTAQTTLKWTTSKKKAATVDGNGLITATGEGTATITVKTANGKKAKLKVKVVDPYKPTGVTLNYSGTVKLKVGETVQLSADVAPETAVTTLKWSSSKKKYATVDGNGLVTAVKPGKVTITVRTANGKKAKVKIKVVK